MVLNNCSITKNQYSIMENILPYLSKASDYIVASLPNLALAALLILVGFWVINKVSKALSNTLTNAGFSIEISSFLLSLASIGAKVLLMISAAGMVGINTAAFVGVIAAAGLAIGLALQGSLGNFAAGIVIVVFKPYKVGDWVEVKEKFGKVEDIQIFNTVVVSPGNKTLIIPNGEVINGVITNFSQKGNIRIELQVNMPYSEDFPRVRQLILDGLQAMDGILTDPAPEIGIDSFGDHNVVLSIRPYVEPDRYWVSYYEIMAMIKRIYHENNISVGYAEGFELGKVGK